MNTKQLRVLQVNAADARGGAAKIATDLHESLLQRGMDSFLAVRTKRTDDPRIIEIQNDDYRSLIARALIPFANRLERSAVRGAWKLSRLLRSAAEPVRAAKNFMGIEDFEFPATWKILDLARKPDVLHLHNLHENYFDLRALPDLTQEVPTILTMHDAWLLSGHCAHSFECDRWQTGCGECPDLSIYPAIRADATAINWKRKKEIFSRSKLFIVTPCEWLMDRMKNSILASAAYGSRVIPNGVDLSIFHGSDRNAARKRTSLPVDIKVLLVSADNLGKSSWKDESTLRMALQKLDRSMKEPPLCLAIGEAKAPENIGRIRVEYLHHQNEETLAIYYQAADLYLHISRADTFPSMILEALACGTPVVATAVGGIPEQIKNLEGEGATGFLAAPGEHEQLALNIRSLLEDDALRCRLSSNAQHDAFKRFGLEREVHDYLSLYEEVTGRHHGK